MNLTVTIGEIQTAPKAASLEVIQAFESKLAEFQQESIPVDHAFAGGIYRRTVTMPADTWVTSKYHKTEHFAVILRGTVDVWNRDKSKTRFEGPCMFVTPANTKRVLHTITEVEWATFHATEHTEVELVERDIIDPEQSLLGVE